MSAAPDSSAPPAGAEKNPPPTGAYLGIAALVLIGTVLFATAAIVKVRHSEKAPPAEIFGVPAWQIATAGFVSTLAGGLWLRRLVK